MTEENKGEEMETSTKSTTPQSLSNVANSRAQKQPGSAPLGSGLEARGVHAWFGSHLALKNVSLDFSAGTVTAQIGRAHV